MAEGMVQSALGALQGSENFDETNGFCVKLSEDSCSKISSGLNVKPRECDRL